MSRVATPLSLGLLLSLGFCAPSSVIGMNIVERSFHNVAERNGDYDAFAADLLSVVSEHTGDFRAEVALRRLGEIKDRLRAPRALFTALEKLFSRNDLAPVARDHVARLLANEHLRQGRPNESSRIEDGPPRIEDDPTRIEDDPLRAEDSHPLTEDDHPRIEDDPARTEDDP